MTAAAALRLSWPGGAATVSWPPRARGEPRCPALVAAGEVLAASSHCAGSVLLEIADVIYCPDAKPAEILDRYPGAAVAAAPGRGRGCRVAIRSGTCLNVAVTGPPVTSACAALLGACFVYGWLAAGEAAEALTPAVLTVTGGEPSASWPRAWTRGTPLTFGWTAW